DDLLMGRLGVHGAYRVVDGCQASVRLARTELASLQRAPWPLLIVPTSGATATVPLPPRVFASTSALSLATNPGDGSCPPATSSYCMSAKRKKGSPPSNMGRIGLPRISARRISRSTHTDSSAAGDITTTNATHASRRDRITETHRSPMSNSSSIHTGTFAEDKRAASLVTYAASAWA